MRAVYTHSYSLAAPLRICDVFIHFHSLPLHHLSTAALFKFSRPWLQPRLSIKICVTLHFVLSYISLTSPDDRWLTYPDGVFFTNGHSVIHIPQCLEISEGPQQCFGTLYAQNVKKNQK